MTDCKYCGGHDCPECDAMPKDYQEVEDLVEHVAEVCDSVEFLHGVPVKLPSETKALLRGRIRKALTTYGNARELKGVEKFAQDLRTLIERGNAETAMNIIRAKSELK
jgi:hypothetical protein